MCFAAKVSKLHAQGDKLTLQEPMLAVMLVASSNADKVQRVKIISYANAQKVIDVIGQLIKLSPKFSMNLSTQFKDTMTPAHPPLNYLSLICCHPAVKQLEVTVFN